MGSSFSCGVPFWQSTPQRAAKIRQLIETKRADFAIDRAQWQATADMALGAMHQLASQAAASRQGTPLYAHLETAAREKKAVYDGAMARLARIGVQDRILAERNSHLVADTDAADVVDLLAASTPLVNRMLPDAARITSTIGAAADVDVDAGEAQTEIDDAMTAAVQAYVEEASRASAERAATATGAGADTRSIFEIIGGLPVAGAVAIGEVPPPALRLDSMPAVPTAAPMHGPQPLTMRKGGGRKPILNTEW